MSYKCPNCGYEKPKSVSKLGLKIAALRDSGKTWKQISEQLDVSRGTAAYAYKALVGGERFFSEPRK